MPTLLGRCCVLREAWEESPAKACDECWAHPGQKCLLSFIPHPSVIPHLWFWLGGFL